MGQMMRPRCAVRKARCAKLPITLHPLARALAAELELGRGRGPAGRGALTITLAHASVSVAYVVVVIQARLTGLTVALEEAAADLYASPLEVFARVTLPLLAPALISGWLLAFTLSLDDVVIASFTSGPGASTLPMVVFSAMRLGPTPELYALATLIVAVAASFLAIAWKLGRRA